MHASNFKDLSGQRFGKQIVIRFVEIRINSSNEKYSVWWTRCDCGKERECSLGTLKHGFSCGCYNREVSGISRRLPNGGAARNANLLKYKISAKKRELTWLIPEELFDSLTSQNCFYCGIEPKQICRSSVNSKKVQEVIYNGIDRVDNFRGYEPDNVVTCCKTCNRAKDVMPKEEFILWATRVVQHSSLKG